MLSLDRLVAGLYNAAMHTDELHRAVVHRDKSVQVLTEDGKVFDIVSVEYDPEAEVTYLKCELAEE